MQPKQHYIVLDGLRGIVALLVVAYHVFEAFAFSAGAPYQHMYHGFLGVDFFFILSGFVVSYAYDDRWERMSRFQFYTRRLHRLHPTVILAAFLGLIVFLSQGAESWSGSHPSAWSIVGSFALTLLLIPSPSGCDIRGNAEAFPLNGPLWSLFFEYLASIAYALFLRKLSNRRLAIWTAFCLIVLIILSCRISPGSIANGWSSEPINLLAGLFRMLFAFSLGILIQRKQAADPQSIKVPYGFAAAAIGLVALLAFPAFTVGTQLASSVEMCYQIFTVAIAFPLIIMVGANADTTDIRPVALRSLRMFGRMSYPLYALHYPFIYLLIGYLMKQ